MDASETAGPSGGNGKDKETVKVVVRCRPLFGKELVEGRKSIVTLDGAAVDLPQVPRQRPDQVLHVRLGLR